MTSKYLGLLLVLFALLVASYGRILDSNYQEKKPQNEPESCGKHTPCGWAIYKQLTREIEGLVENTNCKCDQGLHCYRIEDDISSAVYIYRCRERDPHETGDYISR